ncbi:MAG: hypothetical protein ABI707_19735 [Ferruginibacter sp.]
MISQRLDYFAFIVGKKLGGHNAKILDIGILTTQYLMLFYKQASPAYTAINRQPPTGRLLGNPVNHFQTASYHSLLKIFLLCKDKLPHYYIFA